MADCTLTSRREETKVDVNKLTAIECPVNGETCGEAELLLGLGVEKRPDGLVHWRSDSKDHPRNWSARRKAFDTTVIILFEFYT